MAEITEKEYAYWLSRTGVIGAVKAGRLLECAGSYEAVYNMKKQHLMSLDFLRKGDAEAVEAARGELSLRRREYDAMLREGIRFLLPSDPEYPKRLRNMYDMPRWLFVRGALPSDEAPSAALIGARSCTSYGRQEAERLGRDLALAGIQVVSGMARGIDGAGQEGALRNGGASCAVLGSGIDVCYPSSNQRLYGALVERGGILSEYGPGEPPLSWHFPCRNRIISGLSDAVIVVEARVRSGSLITADLALEQGKEVFAFPGRRTDPLSAGCNGLIRQGAAMVTSPEDILDFFQLKHECIKGKKKKEKKTEKTLAKTEKMVYSCLDLQSKHLEEIMQASGLSMADCMEALLKLELKGMALQPLNQYYTRKLE